MHHTHVHFCTRECATESPNLLALTVPAVQCVRVSFSSLFTHLGDHLRPAPRPVYLRPHRHPWRSNDRSDEMIERTCGRKRLGEWAPSNQAHKRKAYNHRWGSNNQSQSAPGLKCSYPDSLLFSPRSRRTSAIHSRREVRCCRRQRCSRDWRCIDPALEIDSSELELISGSEHRVDRRDRG